MNEDSDITKELKAKLPSELVPLLDQRDGAAHLLIELPKVFPPETVADPGDKKRAWELTGLFYRERWRMYEALSIISSLYDQMLIAQMELKRRVGKGMPLVWMSDFYSALGFPVHAKRLLMLILCEDAISMKGEVSPTTSGVYFRLVWLHGLPDSELKRYASEIYSLSCQHPNESLYPEGLLQELECIEISFSRGKPVLATGQGCLGYFG